MIEIVIHIGSEIKLDALYFIIRILTLIEKMKWSGSTHKYNIVVDIQQMLELLIDNSFTVFVTVFQQFVGFPIGTNFIPFLAELFIYFLWVPIYSKTSTCIRRYIFLLTFNSILGYIDETSSHNNNHFQSYVDSLYLSDLEINGFTVSSLYVTAN